MLVGNIQQFDQAGKLNQMLIPLTELQLIYNKIQEEVNLAYTSVLIFVAFDTDALCTLKILTGILKSQNILYEIYPVASYLELEAKIEDSRCMEKVKMIFFINCGGAIDLTQKWFYTERQQQQITLLLLDVHKPIHHANIDHRNIKVVNDGLSNFDKCPTNNDLIQLNNLQTLEMNSSSDQQEILEYKSQPNDFDEGQDQVSYLKRKRQMKKENRAKQKQKKIQINKKIQDYYGKQFSSFPSSMIAFRLARDVNKSCNQYLWLGLVGLTSLFLQSKLSKDVYNKAQSFFFSQTIKLNASIIKNVGDNVGSIYREIDFRFTLLRHWSLYDSMKYSPYMVMKMKLWDDFGINRMHDFITQIGVSLETAKQLYSCMPTKLYNDLKAELFKKAEDFDLEDIFFNSYRRQLDTYQSFACSDYCSAVTAALQQPTPPGINTQKSYQLRRQNFWTAYHLLSPGRIQDIKHFIENHKTFMKILVTQALGILQKSQINPCLQFLYVKFVNNTPQRQLFQHPLRLIKLGQLLMGLYHEKKRSKSKTVKPLVISIQSADNPTCLVVGIVPDEKNPFGTKFIQIVQRNNFDRRHDGFMANIIEIKKQDLVKFIGQINLS